MSETKKLMRPVAGAAVLLVEQNAVAALQISHRAYVLESGRVAVSGSSAELRAHDGVRPVREVRRDEMILDIGPDTADRCSALLQAAGTIIWNGPVGVFEFEQFGEGTRAIAQALARSKAFPLAGAGDTLAAIEKYRVEDGISYVSTGRGAVLAVVRG